ncbi:MAG: hypothetical protein ABIZ91_06470 [Gemmatimonadaceae bacterium]
MAILLVLAMAGVPSGAQGRRGGDRGGTAGSEPTWWGSFAAGYQWSNAVSDPGTDAVWNFDSNWSMRASVEREIAPRTTVGLAWRYSRMPLSITSSASGGVCQPCAADATIASYGITARSGGGRGLHLVYEGFVGATQFNNFTLAPAASPAAQAAFASVRNVDFSWAVATGAGYSLSNEFQIVALYEYGSSVHEKGSNSPFQRRTAQHYTTRLGVRLGI